MSFNIDLRPLLKILLALMLIAFLFSLMGCDLAQYVRPKVEKRNITIAFVNEKGDQLNVFTNVDNYEIIGGFVRFVDQDGRRITLGNCSTIIKEE